MLDLFHYLITIFNILDQYFNVQQALSLSSAEVSLFEYHGCLSWMTNQIYEKVIAHATYSISHGVSRHARCSDARSEVLSFWRRVRRSLAFPGNYSKNSCIRTKILRTISLKFHDSFWVKLYLSSKSYLYQIGKAPEVITVRYYQICNRTAKISADITIPSFQSNLMNFYPHSKILKIW